jgi:hypothetical protein
LVADMIEFCFYCRYSSTPLPSRFCITSHFDTKVRILCSVRLWWLHKLHNLMCLEFGFIVNPTKHWCVAWHQKHQLCNLSAFVDTLYAKNVLTGIWLKLNICRVDICHLGKNIVCINCSVNLIVRLIQLFK